MKNLIWQLFLSFVLVLLSCSRMNGEEEIPKKQIIPQKRASFKIALRYVLNHEGFFSNHIKDRGGLTYMGISRNLNKDWKGWPIIEQYIKHHSVKWNDSIPIGYLNWQVVDYYLSIWVQEDFYSIEDQDIANYTLDTRINCTIGSYIIKKTLIEMGYPLIANNIMDSTTVRYLNIVSKWEFLCLLMQNKIDFYTGIVDRHQDQIVFISHWIKRVKVR